MAVSRILPTRFVHKETYEKLQCKAFIAYFALDSEFPEFSYYAFTYSLKCSLDAQHNFVVA